MSAWAEWCDVVAERERALAEIIKRDPVREARVELWLEYRAKRMAGDEVSPDGFRAVGQELGLC